MNSTLPSVAASPLWARALPPGPDPRAQLGAMYATRPGFYLLAGPDWNGQTLQGITQVFQCPTRTGFVAPRVFQDDTPQDKRAIQEVLRGINMYPLAQFDGRMQTTDWSKLPHVPAPQEGDTETRWVLPEKFVDELGAVLAAAQADPAIKQAMTEGAQESDKDLVEPLFQFRNQAKFHAGINY